MLNVDIEKILPVTEARDSLNKIVEEVNSSDQLYVLTVNGKPNAVVVGVQHLEKLTGSTPGDIMAQSGANSTTDASSAATPASAQANTDDDTKAAPTVTPAPSNTVPDSNPAESTPNQPLVGPEAEGIAAPLPTSPDKNVAPTDTAQTMQPGAQQDPEAPAPLNGEPDDAAPLTTGTSITPDDPFATPGPEDLPGQNNNQGQPTSGAGV